MLVWRTSDSAASKCIDHVGFEGVSTELYHKMVASQVNEGDCGAPWFLQESTLVRPLAVSTETAIIIEILLVAIMGCVYSTRHPQALLRQTISNKLEP